MRFFSKFKRSGRFSGKKLAASAAVFLTVVSAGIVGVSSLDTGKAVAGDCSGNSIIKCGASSRTDFINDVKRSSELQHIYANFGLSSSDYSRFISSAKLGYAYRADNTIRVDGKVVATNVGSIGRWANYQGSGYRTFVIKGAGTYYGNLNQKSIAPSSASLPVEVLFDSQGKMQFATMMSSCANPTYGTPATPPTCKELNAKSLGNNKYELTTSINTGTAKESVNKVVYTFSDGRSAVTSTSSGYKVDVTLTKNVTVTAHVYVNVPGGGIAESSHCQKTLTYTPPAAVYACGTLTMTPGKTDSQGNTAYTLAATASAKNATIKSYTFAFGDGKSATVSTRNTSASTAHVYAPGTYTAKVLVTFVTNTGKTVTAGNGGYCLRQITIKPLSTSLACVDIKANKGSVAANGATSYTFTATAKASNATISSYKFEFGDANATQTINTSATSATSAAHTYAPGSYTAKVTVTGKDVYGKTITSTVPDCQTPIQVNKVTSSLACVSFDAHKGVVSANGNTSYTFTANAKATNATITSYTIDFGDNGATQTINTSATSVTSQAHVYAPSTTGYLAKVTVTGKDVNGKTVTATSPYCQAGFNVPPVQQSTLACVNLTPNAGAKNDDGSQSYTFTAKASTSNATITSYTFDFGDANATQTVNTAATSVTSQAHTYAPGNYTASVTVKGKDASGKDITAPANEDCSTPITVNEVPTPGITINKTVDGVKMKQVDVGQQFVYQLLITNTGEMDLTNVLVTDNPEADANILLIAADLGTVDTSANTWSYTIPSLAKGASVTVNITAKVTAYKGGNLDNTACVTAPQVTPPTPGQPNECSHATVTVTPPPTTLVNTGAGSVLGLFGVSAVIGTLGHRLFLSRRLSREG